MARAVVLGGGFGGIAAATELRSRLDSDDDVVLIDRGDSFAMGFAKLWDLAGIRPLAQGTRALRDLEGAGIRVVQAEITSVDPDARRVETGAGGFDADALLVALGSRPAPRHRALLTAPGAHDLYARAALPAMRADLAAVASGRVVVAILGAPYPCPPAPYEAALIVDTLLRERGVRDAVEVVVSTPQPITLPVAGVDASRYVADHLDSHGVGLRASHRVTEIDAERRRVVFADGEPLDYDVLLGVPADALPEVLGDTGLAGESGWLEPDPATMRLAPDRVAAVGDCTRIPTATAQLPHAGVFAAAQGRVAARNLVADLGGGTAERFDGRGYCFLELPGEQVAYVEGDFYADPPDVRLTPADHEQFLRKQAYERDLLAAWFG